MKRIGTSTSTLGTNIFEGRPRSEMGKLPCCRTPKFSGSRLIRPSISWYAQGAMNGWNGFIDKQSLGGSKRWSKEENELHLGGMSFGQTLVPHVALHLREGRDYLSFESVGAPRSRLGLSPRRMEFVRQTTVCSGAMDPEKFATKQRGYWKFTQCGDFSVEPTKCVLSKSR